MDLNRTSVELGPLEPGSTYLVAVAGVNSNGVGNLSEYQTVMTLSPEGWPLNASMYIGSVPLTPSFAKYMTCVYNKRSLGGVRV